MTHGMSLKHVEREAFASQFEDGLWDICTGSYLLIFVFVPFLGKIMGDFWSSSLLLPWWGLNFAAVKLIKKYVVTPRRGTVNFGPRRKARLKKSSFLLLVLCTVGLGLGILSHLRLPSPWVINARFGLTVLAVSWIAAYFLDFTRLYFYGVMSAAGPMVGELLWQNFRMVHHGYPVVFGTISGIMILIGLVLFVRFLRAHPLPSEEALPRQSDVTGDRSQQGGENEKPD